MVQKSDIKTGRMFPGTGDRRFSGLSYVYTYNESKQALIDSTHDALMEVAGSMATQVNVSNLEKVQPGDENASFYLALVDQLREMRSQNSELVNCYIMQLNHGQITFLADDAEDGPCAIGESYNSTDYDQIVTAMTTPSASDQIYNDSYGNFMSGYAPIIRNGTTLAIFGVDMDASTVLSRENFIGNTMLIIMSISILIAAFIIGMLAFTLICDIKKLNTTANRSALAI